MTGLLPLLPIGESEAAFGEGFTKKAGSVFLEFGIWHLHPGLDCFLPSLGSGLWGGLYKESHHLADARRLLFYCSQAEASFACPH
jgi:hypothetical protein